MTKNSKLSVAIGAFCLAALGGTLLGGSAFADTTYTSTDFPDEGFFNCVKNYISGVSVADTSITQEQAESLTNLTCMGGDYDVVDVTGIEYLTNLKEIQFSNQTDLEEIDLSENNKLTQIVINGNSKLSTLTIGEQPQLEIVRILENDLLEELDFSEANKLSQVRIIENPALEEIVFGEQPSLDYNLDIYNNALKSLDLSKVVNVRVLNASGNELDSVDLSKNTALKTLVMTNNKLTGIDLSENANLQFVYLSGNSFDKIDVSSFNKNMVQLYLDDNVLVRTNFAAVQSKDGGDYYAASSVSDSNRLMFVPMLYSVGLTEGKSKITTEGATFYKEVGGGAHCADDSYCIIFDADILDYQNYIQLAYIGDGNDAIMPGADNSKLNYRLEINLEAFEEDESDLKVPDTGEFGGGSNAILIAKSLGLLGLSAGAMSLIVYGIRRNQGKVKFGRKNF